MPHDEYQDPSDQNQEPLSSAEEPITPSAEDISSLPQEDPYEGAVPPGYNWPTHGGYLGCLLAQLPACLIGGFLGSTLYNYLILANVLPNVVVGLLAVATFIAGMIFFGRIGWVLGRRFYRAYEQPVPTWGENDTFAAADETESSAQGDSGQQSGALRPETP